MVKIETDWNRPDQHLIPEPVGVDVAPLADRQATVALYETAAPDPALVRSSSIGAPLEVDDRSLKLLRIHHSAIASSAAV